MKSPQEEALAREFEQWQKSFNDEVVTLFAESNRERGNASFDSWREDLQSSYQKDLRENWKSI